MFCFRHAFINVIVISVIYLTARVVCVLRRVCLVIETCALVFFIFLSKLIMNTWNCKMLQKCSHGKVASHVLMDFDH